MSQPLFAYTASDIEYIRRNERERCALECEKIEERLRELRVIYDDPAWCGASYCAHVIRSLV
jgi:hypothetical protein